jgi:hypothetical protein
MFTKLSLFFGSGLFDTPRAEEGATSTSRGLSGRTDRKSLKYKFMYNVQKRVFWQRVKNPSGDGNELPKSVGTVPRNGEGPTPAERLEWRGPAAWQQDKHRCEAEMEARRCGDEATQ